MTTTFDFSPWRRSTVGFDRLFDVLESASRGNAAEISYPPYDIETLGDDAYRITLAVAGFAQDEIDITAQENLLIVAGRKTEVANDGELARYVHRGIAARAFERRFQLADHVRVQSADLAHGLLAIELVREVPEAMKPRKIGIGGATATALPSNDTDVRKAA